MVDAKDPAWPYVPHTSETMLLLYTTVIRICSINSKSSSPQPPPRIYTGSSQLGASKLGDSDPIPQSALLTLLGIPKRGP